MTCVFRTAFLKDLKKHRDKKLQAAVRRAIEAVENAQDLTDLAQIKRLQGHPACYRYRLGDWRIGLYVDGEQVEFTAFGHRSEIYRRFP